jgi:hypothetical protein
VKPGAVVMFLADVCLWCSGGHVVLGLHLATSERWAFGALGVWLGAVIGPLLVASARAAARNMDEEKAACPTPPTSTGRR